MYLGDLFLTISSQNTRNNKYKNNFKYCLHFTQLDIARLSSHHQSLCQQMGWYCLWDGAVEIEQVPNEVYTKDMVNIILKCHIMCCFLSL